MCYGSHFQLGHLEGPTSSVDISTKENMNQLIHIGKELLKKRVSRVNLETGTYDEVTGEGTNADALAHFAEILAAERRSRQPPSPDSS